MTHRDAIVTARSGDRAMVDREHHRVALDERHHLDSRLHAWALFGQDEFAAGEILARPRQQDRDLQRKDVLAIQVLVQAIIIAGAIAQQQRRRPRLSRLVAPRQERIMLGGKARRQAEPLVPAIGDRREARIERRA